MDIDLANGNSILFHHTAEDGMQGPFKNATFVYVQTSAFVSHIKGFAESKSFVVYSLYIDYMSHFKATVRKSKSTQVCSTFEMASKKPSTVTQLNTDISDPFFGFYQTTIQFWESQCSENLHVFDPSEDKNEMGNVLTKIFASIQVPPMRCKSGDCDD